MIQYIKNFVKRIIGLVINFILGLLAIHHKIKLKKNICNKKIMILIGKISKGGAERAVVNLAEKLAKNNEVIIVTYQDINNKSIQNYKCTVKTIKVKTVSYKMIYEIRKIKKQNNITHCISFGTNSNFINSITRLDEKVIISVRNYLSVAEKDLKSKIKYKISLKLCDSIVAVSKQVEQDQIKIYNVNPEKICTIPNYCNKEYILESMEKYDIDEEDKKVFEGNKVIITIGKLKEQKGQWHLIRAFKKVIEKNKDAKLVILGEGKLKNYLKKLIKQMNLEDNVYMLGHKNKNIYTYIKKSKIFVFPSLFEGMSNVMLEAMQCGLPIIATDCYGGNKEIIAPEKQDEVKSIEKCEYGILIPKLDFKYYGANDELTKEEIIMANAINEMLNNEELYKYYKEQSLKRIKEYDKDDYVKKWEELL